jgi:hypothetical protein
MNLRLPTFKTTKIRAITACGKVESDSPAVNEILKTQKDMTAKYVIDGNDIYFSLLFGGKTGKHLHMDCVFPTFIKKSKLPKITNQIDDVLNRISDFNGVKVEVGVVGLYISPVAEIPEKCLIRSLTTEQKTGDISIRLSSGSFTISGAPVTKMSWSMDENKNEAMINLQAEKQEVVDAEYLTRINDWIDKQYNLFILGKA